MTAPRPFSALATEAVHPATADLDLLPTEEIVRRTLDEGLASFRACRAGYGAE